jgi:hypothetical protein
VDPVAGVLGKLMLFESRFQLGQPHGIIPPLFHEVWL